MRNNNGILFINGSPNKNGNTAALAKTLLAGHDHDTLNLVDYKLYSYGQKFDDDQFDEVIEKIKTARTIVIGSPLYWHNLCGQIRDLLDKCYGPVPEGAFAGKQLLFIFQGAAPEKWMLEAGEFTIKRFAALYGLDYLGMATNRSEARQLANKLG